MKRYFKTHNLITSTLSKLLRPIPIPLTREELAKVISPVMNLNAKYLTHKQTTDLLRQTLNAHCPASNPYLRDHFTNLGVLSNILSAESSRDGVPTVFELRQRLLTHLSTTTHPMTAYAQLKPAGELTKEAGRAILFNPNLISYEHINTIATESCIPASYVVAKLMKIEKPRLEEISMWMQKVPSIHSLWKFIRELDGMVNRRQPHGREDRIRSLGQCHMDLTAHISYILLTKNVQEGYKLWESWAFWNKYDISLDTRQVVLKVPSLKLLIRACQTPIERKPIYEVLNWDYTVIQVASQSQFRRVLILDLLNLLISDRYPVRAMEIMRMSEGCLSKKEIVEYVGTIVKDWLSIYAENSPPAAEIDSTRAFFSWVMDETRGVQTGDRAKLERLKAIVDGFEPGLVCVRNHELAISG